MSSNSAEAKRIAEALELTQSMVKRHQKSIKEKTIKAAQHSGTKERRSSKLHQSVQGKTQKKTCKDRFQRQRIDSHRIGCISAQRGAREVSCLEVHGPAVVWRSLLKDLPLRNRAGYVRRYGSVMIVDLEALTCEKEKRLSANTTVAGMSMHPTSGRPQAI